MKTGLAILALFLLGGCTSGGSARWYAPATWFSHAPADSVDKTEAKEDVAREKALKAAQRATHETAAALAEAPESRPVEVAAEANGNAVVLLDQALGPMTASQVAAVDKQVAGLLSENAALRAEAEKLRGRERDANAKLSDRLAAASAAAVKAKADLRDAFERENELANELRSQRALFWIAAGLAVVLGLGWLYVQMTLGGLPGAMRQGLTALRAQKLIPPEGEPNIFDTYLNRSEQRKIARTDT